MSVNGDRIREAMRLLPIPVNAPVFRAMIDGPGASFWVRLDGFDNPDGWLWIDLSTMQATSVSSLVGLTSRARLLAASNRLMVFLDWNHLDVESIHVFRLSV